MIRSTPLFLFFLFFSFVVSAQQTERQYLSGTGSDRTVNWDFFCTGGMNAGKWTSIPVPSNWELQGFGTYNYGFSKEATRGKEQGKYRYRFTVPVSWKDRVNKLVFEGVMTDAEVKLNGKPAGAVHQGAFYVFSYDVSSLLKYDAENLLEVTVSKHSANQSVNEAERKADFWIFGGIFRPIYLSSVPVAHIERVQLDARADGTLRAAVHTTGPADEVELTLTAANGKTFGRKTRFSLTGNRTQFEAVFSKPDLWSAEFPHLYLATFKLLRKGRVQHVLQKKTGFRTIEVRRRDGVYVNGKKIRFKGVNRHSFHPNSGRTTSKAISIADVRLIKDMNMNAVRMSHYPPDGHFLDVCDSLGLYVMDELAGWHGHYNDTTGKKLLKEMFRTDENHPSIIFWANGNEGGHNRTFDTEFNELDIQKRPVVHPWEVFGGFETTHYREFNYGIGNYDHGHNIVMPTEFLHGMFDGGHGAGIEDYWNAMLRNPLSAGGFLWDLADQAIVRTDRNNLLDTDGNHAPDGIVGPYHEKEGSYFTIKEVWSPVYIEPREITPYFDGRLTIENRYDFTNLNRCGFSWKLKTFADGPVPVRTDSGSVAAPAVAPGAKGTLQLQLPAGWQNHDVLYVTATGADGRELFTWTYPVKPPAEKAIPMLVKAAAGKPVVSETSGYFEITAAGLTYRIDRQSGLLKDVKTTQGILPFANGPVIQEGQNNFKNFTLVQEGDSVVIASTFDKKESYNTLRWTVFASGLLKMEVAYFPGAYFSTFVGLNFSYPEDEISGVDYFGRGPYRVWKNRMKGQQLGVWHKDYNTSATGEVPFQYPEFKGYHANMYWCKFIGKRQSFKVITDQEDVFLRLFTPKKSKDTEYDNMSPTFPAGDISFMNGISAIGTKTQKPETTGPMGMKHVFYDFEKEPARALHMSLYFDFNPDRK
ncbi:glycoside hydrolase family 2 TIM barrel-domain containing protein [Pedobacter sp. SYP-B3415]|uniref:glycoside hydrolase family 2 TIM barrel-domain containing protein n=1 Tax=Pedobacter sp. SYP-B3415 TaxID=2496641 RepID=UPI00101C5AF9|nr:glycoside hydrolase family 2 TIM barrel-domain containing protein [Pedobacter sp. SYP-B3415]